MKKAELHLSLLDAPSFVAATMFPALSAFLVGAGPSNDGRALKTRGFASNCRPTTFIRAHYPTYPANCLRGSSYFHCCRDPKLFPIQGSAKDLGSIASGEVGDEKLSYAQADQGQTADNGNNRTVIMTIAIWIMACDLQLRHAVLIMTVMVTVVEVTSKVIVSS